MFTHIRFAHFRWRHLLFHVGLITGIGFAALLIWMQLKPNLEQIPGYILLVALISGLFSGLLSLLLSEELARPIRRLTQVVERMAAGELDARMLPTTRDEVGQLTLAFNHMAEELQERIADQSKQRSRLESVLANMMDGVLIINHQGEVRLINRAAAHLLETTSAQALNRAFAQVAREHHLIDLWQRCQKEQEPLDETIVMQAGSRLVRIMAAPIRPVSSQGYLVVLQDLTELRRLETVRRDFVSNLSHELRTPLASLQALTDTLRDGALDDPPAAQRFLNRMDGEIDALTQMVEELLELSRIESGRTPFHFRAASVAQVVGEPVERLRPQAQRSEVALSWEIPPDLPLILADVERLGRVVTNLVHNAIKFTPAGGQVHVSAQLISSQAEGAESDRWVQVQVLDSGPGIPKHEQVRIFERFYKVDRARASGGTGLGLAIAKHIVQAHQGRIWVESQPGAGSRFLFTLPTESDP